MANNDAGEGVVMQVMKHYCQVETCEANLDGAKKYHKRHKVCQVHAKAPIVLLAGLKQRFCQQCSKYSSFKPLFVIFFLLTQFWVHFDWLLKKKKDLLDEI